MGNGGQHPFKERDRCFEKGKSKEQGMSLERLRRQDFHTCLCSIVLILINACAFYFLTDDGELTVIFSFLYFTIGIVLGIFDIALRKEADLLKRHLLSSGIVSAAMILFGERIDWSVLLFAVLNLIYGIWSFPARKWLRHEICPGWTLFLYDSRENQEEAEKAAECRKDLIAEAYRLKWDPAKEGMMSSLDEVEHVIQTFHIQQILMCLENGSEEILKYCREKGMIAYVKGTAGQSGKKLDKAGFYYVRPVPEKNRRLFGRCGKGKA